MGNPVRPKLICFGKAFQLKSARSEDTRVWKKRVGKREEETAPEKEPAETVGRSGQFLKHVLKKEKLAAATAMRPRKRGEEKNPRGWCKRSCTLGLGG